MFTFGLADEYIAAIIFSFLPSTVIIRIRYDKVCKYPVCDWYYDVAQGFIILKVTWKIIDSVTFYIICIEAHIN